MKAALSHARLVASALVVGFCSLAACGDSGTSTPSSMPTSSMPPSTSSGPTNLEDGPPPVAPTSVADLAAQLDAAVATGDACVVWDVVRRAVPDLSRPSTVKRFYGSIADHLRDSERLVPGSIDAAWLTAINAADTEARRGGVAGVAFDDRDVRSALDAIDSECPPK